MNNNDNLKKNDKNNKNKTVTNKTKKKHKKSGGPFSFITAFFDKLFGKKKNMPADKEKHNSKNNVSQKNNDIKPDVKKTSEYSEIKELTEADYQAFRENVIAKLNTFPEDSRFDVNLFNKRNIFVVFKILSDSKLYNNDGIKRSLRYILPETDTMKSAKAKIILMNKFISSKRWYLSACIVNNIGNFLVNAETEERADSIIMFIDKFLCDDDLYKNDFFIKNLDSIVYGIYNKESALGKMALLDKYTTDANWQKSGNVRKNLVYMLLSTNSEESAKKLMENIDTYLFDEYGDSMSQKEFNDLIRYGIVPQRLKGFEEQ